MSVSPGSYAEAVTITVHLPDELAARLAAAAARRGVGVGVVATELVSAGLADTEDPAEARPMRRLSFAGIGASATGRSAAHAEETLAEGFGRD